VLKGLVARFYIHEIVSPANQYGCSILIAIHKEVNVTRLKLNVALMATALVVTTSSYAAEVTFEETKILLQNEDVKSFQLKDINGDHRLDIIWQTNNGELKYKLQNNQAMMNFKNLPGTKWRLNYDNNDDSKTIEFFAKGGVIENQSNYFWNIVNWEVNENNELSFCTDVHSGLNRTRCLWEYQVTEILPNALKGIDLKSGQPWVAHKIIK